MTRSAALRLVLAALLLALSVAGIAAAAPGANQTPAANGTITETLVVLP